MWNETSLALVSCLSGTPQWIICVRSMVGLLLGMAGLAFPNIQERDKLNVGAQIPTLLSCSLTTWGDLAWYVGLPTFPCFLRPYTSLKWLGSGRYHLFSIQNLHYLWKLLKVRTGWEYQMILCNKCEQMKKIVLKSNKMCSFWSAVMSLVNAQSCDNHHNQDIEHFHLFLLTSLHQPQSWVTTHLFFNLSFCFF